MKTADKWQDKVDINAASEMDLRDVKGLGEGRAAALVEHRDKHGYFRTVDDIDRVPQLQTLSEEERRKIKEQIKAELPGK